MLTERIFVSLISFLVLHFSGAFNVDFNHPIIISNHADGPGSYFGATVQLLKKNKDVTWVIIGAPRANSSYYNHAGIHEPGTVWRCSVGKERDVCGVVMMDPTKEEVTEKGIKDRKDGGWLGGSLSGDESDRFVACAGRWANQQLANNPNTSEYFLNGICYWRPKKDVLEDRIPDLPSNYRLLPLSGREHIRMQESFNWTYAQSGFSMHVSSENKLILGAPGIYSWRGSVIQYSDASELRLQRNGQPDVIGSTFSESLVVKPELSKFLRNDSYFGYSVTSGKFFMEKTTPEKKIQYVSGAPRGASLMGQVVVFYFPKNNSDPMNTLAIINGTQIGSYFGSVLCVVDINMDGFDDLIIGAPRYSTKRSLAIITTFSASRKSVSFDDNTSTTSTTPDPTSVPGATFAFKGVKPAPSRGDEGSVFVYMSSGVSNYIEAWRFFKESLKLKDTLLGDNEAWAQFGTAISSPGDINNDGFNDIVVGAPYSKDGDGSIYIYHGTSTGVNIKYSQVIHASQIDSSLRGFGYSLSRGTDLDNNGYNDFAVGSYQSAQAIVLRTRPSALVTGHVKSSVIRVPLNATKFQVSSCVTFSGFNLPNSIIIGVKLFMDVDAKPHRVLLSKPEEDGSTSDAIMYEELAYRDAETCTKFNAVVVLPLESALPVKIRQETFIPELDFSGSRRKKRSAVHPTKYDIRFSAGSANLNVSGIPLKEFCSTCPLANSQLQNTSILSLPMEVLCGDDNKCTADLRVQAQFQDIEPGTNFTIGSAPTVTLLLDVKNVYETAIAPAVTISYTRRNLLRVPPVCEKIHVNSSLFYTYKCSLGKMMVKGDEAHLSLEFDMSDLVAGGQMFEKEYIFHVEATTSSELVTPAALDLILQVNATADVHIFGSDNQTPFSPTTLAHYQILSHNYNVRLHGASPIDSMLLRFQVPVNLTNENESLQVIHVFHPKAEVDGIEMFCTSTYGKFERTNADSSSKSKNSKGSIESDPNLDAVMIQSSISKHYSKSGGRRDLKKRDLRSVAKAFLRGRSSKLLQGSTFSLNCTSDAVECMDVLCKFNHFKPSSRGSVTFAMRISTDVTKKLFEQEVVERLVIESMGEIILQNVDSGIQLGNTYPDKGIASTSITLDRPKPISRWVYLLSIVGGILVVICIAFGLWMCGCFERKQRGTIADEIDAGEGEPLNDSDEREMASSPLEPIQEELEENST